MAICESCSAWFEPGREVEFAAGVEDSLRCSACRAPKEAEVCAGGPAADELSGWFDQAVEADRAESLSLKVTCEAAARADLFEPVGNLSEPVGDFPEDSPARVETVAADVDRPEAARADVSLAGTPAPRIEVVGAYRESIEEKRHAADAEPAARLPRSLPEAPAGVAASVPRVAPPPELGTTAMRVGWALTAGLCLLGLAEGLRG